MKNRLFFQCSYDGTNYSGWQTQPKVPTIQKTIEDRLTHLFHNEPVRIVGCGRTDAGVHAKKYFFHVNVNEEYSPKQLMFKLNNMLPSDIAMTNVFNVHSEAHARFDATERTYRYFIHQKKKPFLQQYSWYFTRELSIEKMNKAAALLIGNKDFTSFSKLHTDVNNNFCEIKKAVWHIEEDEIFFEVTANRFLRNMVRAIVGTLINSGLGLVPPERINEIIAHKDRGKAGVSVPAKGLFLYDVSYPFIK